MWGRKMVAGLAAVIGINAAAGEAMAQDKHKENKPSVTSESHEDIGTLRQKFIDRLQKYTTDKDAQVNMIAHLDADLQKYAGDHDKQEDVILAYVDQLTQRVRVKNALSDKHGTVADHAAAAEHERESTTAAMKSFLNPSVSFDSAMQQLAQNIPDNSSLVYNGIEIQRTKGIFYIDHAQITPASRTKLIDAYKHAAEEMHKRGADVE